MVNCIESINRREQQTLDPDDWEAMRRLGHRMVDDMLAHLETVRERPVWQPVPKAVCDNFKCPPPCEPMGAERAYEDFLDHVLPYAHGNIHPRFWGWVVGAGTPFGMLADMLAAGMNTNATFGDQAATRVELQVLDWFKQWFGYPSDASGILVGGASVANLIGLAVARDANAGVDVKESGVGASNERLLVYGSTETHSSIVKALALLGLGRSAFVPIPTDESMRIDVEALYQRIRADRKAGGRPICVIGNAGTVNTAALDDLNALADLCAEENTWLHVDGAFGALAALSPRLQPLVAGLERSDSVAFDLHKWLHVPYDVGAILVRHAEKHRAVFSAGAAYLSELPGGITAGPVWFNEYGPALSRGFRGLKVWLSLKEHGICKLADLIEQNVDQARYLALLVEQSPRLELLAPVSLNIVCLRYVAEGLDETQLDALNLEILLRLQNSGVAVPSHSTIRGRFAIRVSITNHRSRFDDFDLLVDEVHRIGDELAREHELTPISAGSMLELAEEV